MLRPQSSQSPGMHGGKVEYKYYELTEKEDQRRRTKDEEEEEVGVFYCISQGGLQRGTGTNL
jgi:hypothetical protein